MKKHILASILILSAIIISCANEKPKAESSTSRTGINKESKKENIAESNISNTTNISESGNEDQTDPMSKKQLTKAKKMIKKAGDISGLDAKKLYKLHCTSCHGFKGNLKINGAKDLTKSEIDLQNAVAQVYYGKGLMTSFKPLLSEEEIVAVSKYTETLRK